MAELVLLVDDVVVNRFALDKPLITIGRDSTNDIQIDDSSASNEHARIHIEPSEYLEGHDEIFIEDLGSTNGTFVNDTQIARCTLNSGDIIEIAWNRFKLLGEQTKGAATEHIARV